ncbi:MAG: stage III sporulation protein AA [Clostridium sp.]
MAAKTEKGLKQEIVNLFPVRLRQILEALPLDFARLEEIRLRCGQPILFRIAGKEMGITGSGDLTELGSSGKLENWEKLEKIREKELKDTLEIMGGFSLYAAEEELRQGFYSPGRSPDRGCRESDIKDRQITGLKAASFLNVRVAHEIKGCADQVLPFLYVNGKFVSTLIVSPPGCGKTTLLRDLIRQVSDGSSQKAGKCSFAGVNVGVADERSELGACYQGVPQNDLGMRTDVLDGCPKSEGMLMLIRSMAPAVVAVDEIGGKEDIKAVEYVRNCGCALAATAQEIPWKS